MELSCSRYRLQHFTYLPKMERMTFGKKSWLMCEELSKRKENIHINESSAQSKDMDEQCGLHRPNLTEPLG